jgi:hypothetical protein
MLGDLDSATNTLFHKYTLFRHLVIVQSRWNKNNKFQHTKKLDLSFPETKLQLKFLSKFRAEQLPA